MDNRGRDARLRRERSSPDARGFFRCSPLVEPRVRPTPHRDFTVAERLLRKPLDDVVTVARFICKWLKVAAGISTTADIHERERITMRREVGAAGVIGI